MLGLNRNKDAWRWKAIGKHPAAADYINMNSGTPLMDAIAEWMTKGFDGLAAGRSPSNGPYSWRFWFRGTKKGSLICGVGRDSSDRIGRPYPFLVFGEGPLKGWEKRWVTLPLALDRTWVHIERTASQRHTDLKELSEALRQLTPPQIDPVQTDAPAIRGCSAPEQATVERYRQALRQDGRVLVPLSGCGDTEPGLAAVQWQGSLGACCPEIPRAVFLGGHPQRSFLALIQQPLATADFITLWSV
jgi:type VI secretion system ImpM family protein